MYFCINSSSKDIHPRQTMSEYVLSLLSGTFQLKQDSSSHRLWHYRQPQNKGNHNTVWPPEGAETCHHTRKKHQENRMQMSSARQGKEHDTGLKVFPEGSSIVLPCRPPAQTYHTFLPVVARKSPQKLKAETGSGADPFWEQSCSGLLQVHTWSRKWLLK